MRILITGNLGYVGGWLVSSLRAKYPYAFIAGYDLGYFQNCLTTKEYAPETKLDVQYYGDVRNFDENLLENIDHVIHLAAISNDPIGNKFEQVTLDVNYKASVDIAEKSIKKGVKSFVFASSCSVYGAGGDAVKTENSTLDPLTPYAKSKVLTEEALSKLNAGDTVITCLRFATACGISDRLRLDLVLNDFVASALTTKRIDILSDGTPWRPLINIKDMARAIDWAIGRELHDGGQFLICNTGSNIWNYTVKELAEYVSQRLDNVSMSVNKDAPADKRSYRVNFDLFSSLAPNHTPIMDVVTTINELKDGLNDIDFNDVDFRKSNFMRLNVLNDFLDKEKLDSKLNWIRK
jgi:nucleoside-diphosphate-sugar epimerase